MPAKKYGRPHRRVRAKYAPIVAAGDATCARCGEPILPGERWDMDHDDVDPRRYLGPSHSRCNRATAGAGLANPRARPPRFDGLPDPTPENTVGLWGRHWYGGFNPRCRDCRESGGPCEAALRFTEAA